MILMTRINLFKTLLIYQKNKNFWVWDINRHEIKFVNSKYSFLPKLLKKKKKKKHLIKANNISSSISNRFHNFSSHKGDIHQP